MTPDTPFQFYAITELCSQCRTTCEEMLADCSKNVALAFGITWPRPIRNRRPMRPELAQGFASVVKLEDEIYGIIHSSSLDLFKSWLLDAMMCWAVRSRVMPEGLMDEYEQAATEYIAKEVSALDGVFTCEKKS